MQDIWVSLHFIRSRSTNFYGFVSNGSTKLHHFDQHRRLLHATYFQDPTGYPRILDIIKLRPLEVGTPTRPPRGRPCQTPCSHSWRSGCLYTSFDQDHDSIFFSFLSIKPAMLPASMLGDYSTSASLTPSCFPHRTDLLGNPFLITLLLDLLFLLLLFWIIILAILPATMLRYYSMSASLMPSEIFHRRFNLLEVCFL
jgi:hypothetical protein